MHIRKKISITARIFLFIIALLIIFSNLSNKCTVNEDIVQKSVLHDASSNTIYGISSIKCDINKNKAEQYSRYKFYVRLNVSSTAVYGLEFVNISTNFKCFFNGTTQYVSEQNVSYDDLMIMNNLTVYQDSRFNIVYEIAILNYLVEVRNDWTDLLSNATTFWKISNSTDSILFNRTVDSANYFLNENVDPRIQLMKSPNVMVVCGSDGIENVRSADSYPVGKFNPGSFMTYTNGTILTHGTSVTRFIGENATHVEFEHTLPDLTLDYMYLGLEPFVTRSYDEYVTYNITEYEITPRIRAGYTFFDSKQFKVEFIYHIYVPSTGPMFPWFRGNGTILMQGDSEFVYKTDYIYNFTLRISDTRDIVYEETMNATKDDIIDIDLGPGYTYTDFPQDAIVSVYSSVDGVGIESESIKFYINGTRKLINQPITFLSETAQITITDYFDQVLTDDVFSYSPEMDFPVGLFSLILNSNSSTSLRIEITRTVSNRTFTAILESGASIPYRFLANVSYTFNSYFLDGSRAGRSLTIELSENNLVVTFGVGLEKTELTTSDIANAISSFTEFDLATITILAVVFVYFVTRKPAPVLTKQKTYVSAQRKQSSNGSFIDGVKDSFRKVFR